MLRALGRVPTEVRTKCGEVSEVSEVRGRCKPGDWVSSSGRQRVQSSLRSAAY